jgi:hypothetical protein
MLYLSDKTVGGWAGNYQCRIAADTDTTLAIPMTATHAVFSADMPFWVDDSAITLPSAAAFASTTALKNPENIAVTPGGTLHFRSRQQQDIYVAFYF